MNRSSFSGATPPLTDTVERRRLAGFADLAALERGAGSAPVSGVIRATPEDFVVSERLPFEPSGTGEHLYLRLRKRSQNTRWVAGRLARALGVHVRDVGYAGLKDRHAVAEQWFSVWLPRAATPRPESIEISGVELLQLTRHRSKLRPGRLAGNRFRIRVRELQGDRMALGRRLCRLPRLPVPNFFGAQRFGRDGQNLDLLFGAAAAGRSARNFGLSALRSALFNGYLALRLRAGSWLEALPGEVAYDALARRYHRCEVAGAGGSRIPTGLLWGVGQNAAAAEALRIEQAFFGAFPHTLAVLTGYAPRMSRRPLWFHVARPRFRLDGDGLMLEFELGRGQFATSVLREFVDITDAAAPA